MADYEKMSCCKEYDETFNCYTTTEPSWKSVFVTDGATLPKESINNIHFYSQPVGRFTQSFCWSQDVLYAKKTGLFNLQLPYKSNNKFRHKHTSTETLFLGEYYHTSHHLVYNYTWLTLFYWYAKTSMSKLTVIKRILLLIER